MSFGGTALTPGGSTPPSATSADGFRRRRGTSVRNQLVGRTTRLCRDVILLPRWTQCRVTAADRPTFRAEPPRPPPPITPRAIAGAPGSPPRSSMMVVMKVVKMVPVTPLLLILMMLFGCCFRLAEAATAVTTTVVTAAVTEL